jgi:hypothetical protein
MAAPTYLTTGKISVRSDIAEGFPDLFGEKSVNGRTA